GQPNDPITASPQGIQQIICDAVVHDLQFEQQSKQLIKNVRDGDPSTVLKELVAVKQMMNAIERFIKSKNDNLSEDSVAKQSIEKEIKSSFGKSIGNQFVQHPLESPNEKRPESSISDVLNGEVSFDRKRPNIYHGESSKNEASSEEFDPKEYDKNAHESGDEKVSKSEIINVLTGEVSCDKYTGEEEIHLDGLKIVDDPFVQTHVKQNYE
nr:hypothetical protein [Tanacetum cinerariifolium]